MQLQKRARTEGELRPDILMYGDHPSNEEAIAHATRHDLHCLPDLIIIAGTSLSIPGVTNLIQEFSTGLNFKGWLNSTCSIIY
jgi:NAD-dependent SIR2 family protein deacetylase